MSREEARLLTALYCLFCIALSGFLLALGLALEGWCVLAIGLAFSLALWRLGESICRH
jgi:hypothetical protein